MVVPLPSLLSGHWWLPTPPQPTAFLQDTQNVVLDLHTLPVPPTGTRTKCMSLDESLHGVSNKTFFVVGCMMRLTQPWGFSDGVPSLDLWAEGCTYFPPHPPLSLPLPSLVTGSTVFALAFPPAPGHREWEIFLETAFPLHTATCLLETWSSLKHFSSPMMRRGAVTCGAAHTSSVIFPFFNFACICWACRHFPMSKLLPHTPNMFSAYAQSGKGALTHNTWVEWQEDVRDVF